MMLILKNQKVMISVRKSEIKIEYINTEKFQHVVFKENSMKGKLWVPGGFSSKDIYPNGFSSIKFF